MAAEHDDDAPVLSMSADDCVDNGSEVARHEHIGESAKERAKRPVVTRRVSELLGADLVRPPGDRNGADRGEIRLARR
jgi:hypothetical protein